MFLHLLLTFTAVTANNLEDWVETSRKCERDRYILDVGDLPKPYGILDDEFDPNNTNNYLDSGPKRRVHYGVANIRNHYPFTSICNIKQKEGKFHWCTCLIMSHEYVLTDRLCFRDRPHQSIPTEKIPDILVTYGDTQKSKHKHKRTVVAMFNHPDERTHVTLLKVNEPILFTDDLLPFSPDRWLKTTAWRNFVPKCSTFMCGYGVTEDSNDDDQLKTMMANGLTFSDLEKKNSRSWLGSSNGFLNEYIRWVQDSSVFDAGHYPTACTGDSGGALMYYDRDRGELFLIGMVTGTKLWKKCGIYGVDLAISLIGITGWLSKFIFDLHEDDLDRHKSMYNHSNIFTL